MFFAYGMSDQSFDVWRATGLEPGEQALEATEADLRVSRVRGRRAGGDDRRRPDAGRGHGGRVASRYAAARLPRAMASPAGNRALRATAGGAIDAEAVAARARELGVMGWVRPTGEIHAEGAPDAVRR